MFGGPSSFLVIIWTLFLGFKLDEMTGFVVSNSMVSADDDNFNYLCREPPWQHKFSDAVHTKNPKAMLCGKEMLFSAEHQAQVLSDLLEEGEAIGPDSTLAHSWNYGVVTG